jgi:hypothetical protein
MHARHLLLESRARLATAGCSHLQLLQCSSLSCSWCSDVISALLWYQLQQLQCCVVLCTAAAGRQGQLVQGGWSSSMGLGRGHVVAGGPRLVGAQIKGGGGGDISSWGWRQQQQQRPMAAVVAV